MTIQAVATGGNTVGYDPQVSGASLAPRVLALGDGTSRVATSGICRAVDLSSVPATISANGHTSDIDVAAFTNLLWSVVAGGASGTNPTVDWYVDYSDGAGNVIAAGVVHLAQFTGAGATYSNVGPATGGGGFMLPPAIQVRWVIGGTATPTFTGISHKLFGR